MTRIDRRPTLIEAAAAGVAAVVAVAAAGVASTAGLVVGVVGGQPRPDEGRCTYTATKDAAPDRVVPGGCNICFNCCTVKFHFKNNKLIKITGNDDDPLLKGRVCPKSQLTLQMYHSEHRLLYPQKRVGARGEGKGSIAKRASPRSTAWYQTLA